MLSESNQQRFARLRELYPTPEALCLPLLTLLQQDIGEITPEAIAYTSKELDLSEEHVEGVATFYTMYNHHPRGKYHIQICKNISCMLMGALPLIDYLKQQLKVGPNQVTKDGLFSYEPVECLAACDMAPMMLVNENYHGPLTQELVDEILDEYRKKDA